MVFGLTKTWLKGWDASKYGFLNPVFEPNMLHQYDLSYGYQAHHIRCIKENPKGTEAPFDLLNLKGLDVRRVLAPDHAAKLAARARQADRTIHLGDDLTAEEVELGSDGANGDHRRSVADDPRAGAQELRVLVVRRP